ncbi:MAG TPA: hypothetical protein VGU20_01520 [Stellaceae bacterium]|nr:hypothetical protein [Stellaceae bacterium]
MDARHSEQRLIMRILAQYRGLCRGTGLPRRAQINPALFGRDWAYCLLVDLDPHLEASRFAYIGDKLGDPTWPAFERQTLADCGENTLLHAATAYVPRVLARRLPISRSGIGLHHETPILYRSVLLPLSESGAAIDGLLGAVNFREIPVREEVHPLGPQTADVAQTAMSVSAAL